MESPELRRARYEKYFKWAVGLLGCALIAPIAFLAVKGLIGLIVALIIGLSAMKFAPVFALKLSNQVLRSLKSEAEKNPIETMQGIYLKGIQAIGEGDKKIVNFEARLEDFKSKMVLFKKKYPEEADRYQEVADKMTLVLEGKKRGQRAAKLEAQNYKHNIEKANAIWQMSLDANGLTELSGDLKDKATQEILKAVAFDSVTHSFNAAVAQLSMDAESDLDFALPERSSAGAPIPIAASRKEVAR